MADEQTDKPLSHLALVEKEIERPEPKDAAQRLREFEDRVMGKPPRLDGKIERGHGSRFSQLSPEDKRAHAAHENLVGKETDLVAARAALAKAEAEHAEALAKVDALEHADAGQ